LDRSHIVNVTIAEPAETPVIPTRSRLFTFLVGLFAALITGIGSAVAAEYLSPSLKTPEDVQVLLDVPVLVSVSSHRR
jgi:capsular polysaccharide biosynthesis protein